MIPYRSTIMKRILFVEDDEMSRDVIPRASRSGYEIVMVENGNKALNIVATQPFDLIILDMSMPGPSRVGRRAVQPGQILPATASIPILALSAHAMSSDRKKALDSGCGDFDSKPVNLARLVGKIEALLKRSEQPTT